MTDYTDDANAPTVRIAMTVSPIDAKRLKQAGVDFGAPAAVIARTLVNHGLDHIDDPVITDVLTDASQAERDRRSQAASRGGKTGGGSNRKISQHEEGSQ